MLHSIIAGGVTFEPTITLGGILVFSSVMALVWKLHEFLVTWQERGEQHDVLWLEYLERHGLDRNLRPIHRAK